MFYEGDEVCTSNEVSKVSRDTLIKYGIKPGTKGIVVSEVTHVTVNFNGNLITLLDTELDFVEDPRDKYNGDGDDEVNRLMGIFGMKK